MGNLNSPDREEINRQLMSNHMIDDKAVK